MLGPNARRLCETMATKLLESRVDHEGEPLPEGVYALVDPLGDVVSYKARWRESDENGVDRQRSKSFSRRALGSLDKARVAAVNHREAVLEIVRAGNAVARSEPAARLTLGELFKEWIAHHAAHNTGERYAKDSVRTWDKHIEPRLGRVKLAAIETDPGINEAWSPPSRSQSLRLAVSTLSAAIGCARRQ